MKFETVTPTGAVECFALLKTAEVKTSVKGSKYLDATIANKTGEMNAKCWDYNEAVCGTFAPGELVKLRGTVENYKGSDQFRIQKIRAVTKEDGVDPADFVPGAAFSGQQMFDELYRLAEGFADEDLRRIVCTVLNDQKEKLLYWPAAFKMHHAMRGGLLCHTLSVVRLAQQVCKIYPFVDEELLVAGAALHDIGKLEEFEINKAGLVTGYSPKGNLMGHLAGGAVLVAKASEQLGITSEVPMLLSHMLLSHHGNPEYGAAVLPQFLEAELLSQLDYMDAAVYEIMEATLNVKPGETTGRVFGLDNRKLYNHGRQKQPGQTPKLF